MHPSFRALLLLTASLSGCQGVVWGNLGVLLLTVGIFCGTVFLGRPTR
jgi:hypothetical protein